ncbi:MAG: hypothetical protein IMZ62_12795 [Chloroflexi bacterium]|nr:hypothetical protein [Chloroflexota bacterium]MBE3119491.1 hypothetical protein [Candidatus Atribacteria bacterium]
MINTLLTAWELAGSPHVLLKAWDIYGRTCYVDEAELAKAMSRGKLCPIRAKTGKRLMDLPPGLRPACVMIHPDNIATLADRHGTTWPFRRAVAADCRLPLGRNGVPRGSQRIPASPAAHKRIGNAATLTPHSGRKDRKMSRHITIATAHSRTGTLGGMDPCRRKSITVPLQGGDPWYAYVWIDDVCFAITKSDEDKYPKVTRQK